MMTEGAYPTLVKMKNVYARYAADTGESDPPSVNSWRLLVKSFQFPDSGMIFPAKKSMAEKEIRHCRGPNVVIDDGQVEVPISQLISCLDSSLGRASARRAEVRAPPVTCLSRRSPRG
jgi:hypothetical protein